MVKFIFTNKISYLCIISALGTEFKTSPQNAWVAQGDNGVLECDPPTSNPQAKVFWKKNGNLIDIKGDE